MREIRFRAWNNKLKMMFHPCNANDQTISFYDDRAEIDLWCSDGVFDSIPVDNLMQYTGLHDDLNKEIYEGDIVSVSTCDYHDTTVHEVQYGLNHIDFYPAFILKGFESDSNSFSHVFCEGSYTATVIGNIYENPELLNGD